MTAKEMKVTTLAYITRSGFVWEAFLAYIKTVEYTTDFNICILINQYLQQNLICIIKARFSKNKENNLLKKQNKLNFEK